MVIFLYSLLDSKSIYLITLLIDLNRLPVMFVWCLFYLFFWYPLPALRRAQRLWNAGFFEEKSKYIDDDGNVIKMPGADYADLGGIEMGTNGDTTTHF